MTSRNSLLLCAALGSAGLLFGCLGGGGGGGTADGGADGDPGSDMGDATADAQGDAPDVDGDTVDADTPDTDDTGDADEADTAPVDSDGDGVADEDDICPGFDDNIDEDRDNIPDGCDPCIRPGAQGDECPGTAEFDSSFGNAGIVMIGMEGRDVALADVQYSPLLGVVLAGSSRDTAGDLDFFVARLRDGGSLSPTFGADGVVSADRDGRDDQLRSMALAQDGSHILAAGSVVGADGTARPAIVKLTADGLVDVAYGDQGWAIDGAGLGTWEEIGLDAAGNAVTAGTQLDFPSTVSLRRYLPSGASDPAFTLAPLPVVGVDTVVRAAVLGPDAITYVVGHAEQGYDDDALVVAVNDVGALHDGFNAGAPVNTDYTEGRGDGEPGHPELSAETIHAVTVDSAGRIVATGEVYRQSDGGRDMFVVRYLADGTLDATFGVNGVVTIDFAGDRDAGFDLAVDAQDRIVAVGRARRDGRYGVAVARLLGDGTPDPDFGDAGLLLLHIGDTGDRADAVAIQSDGRIVIAGRSDTDVRRQALVLRIWD